MRILYLIQNYITLINPNVKGVHLTSEKKITVISFDGDLLIEYAMTKSMRKCMDQISVFKPLKLEVKHII